MHLNSTDRYSCSYFNNSTSKNFNFSHFTLMRKDNTMYACRKTDTKRLALRILLQWYAKRSTISIRTADCILCICNSTQYRHSPTYARSGASRILRKSDSSYISSTEYANNRESSSNPNSKTVQPDRPQPNRPAACVIALRYSSVTFVSQGLSLPQGSAFKNVTF